MEQRDRAQLLLEGLRNRIKDAPSTAMKSEKAVVDRDEVIKIIDKISEIIAHELREFREVTDMRAKIINDAKIQANEIRYRAEKDASRIRVTKFEDGEAPSFRMSELNNEEKNSLRTANDIYAASIIYTDEMLSEVDHQLNHSYEMIQQEYEKMLDTLKVKMEEITSSKNDLVRNLNELKTEDRYSQILELSQLLSNELYRTKEKQLAKDRETRAQMKITFDEDEEKAVTKKRPEINPDRSEVKIETKRPEKTKIATLDRSEEKY